MINIKTMLFILFAVVIPLSAETILLQDNFNDNVLDTNKWTALTSGIVGTPAVQETNQQILLTGRGYLITKQEFNPVTWNLRIRGRWTFVSSDDFLQILTRSDAVPTGAYSETQNGIEFLATAISDSMSILSRGTASATSVSQSYTINAGESFDFDIMDNGTNLSFTLTKVGTPGHTLTITTTSTSVMPSNYIVFHNRENGRQSYLDDVLITANVPEIQSCLIVALGMALGWFLKAKRKSMLQKSLSIFFIAFMILSLSCDAATLAYWKFNEGVNNQAASGANSILDYSGNNHHATPVGNAVYRDDGIHKGIEFDGIDDYAYNDSIQISPSGNWTQLTYEVVLNVKSLTGSWNHIIETRNYVNWIDGITINTATQDFRYGLTTTSGSQGWVVTNYKPLMDTWYHIALTYDGSSIKFYVNGNVVASQAWSGSLTPQSGLDLSHPEGCSPNIILDEVRVSDVALTSTQFLTIPEPCSVVFMGLSLLLYFIHKKLLKNHCGIAN